jgi:hypothetical protein
LTNFYTFEFIIEYIVLYEAIIRGHR